MSKLNFGTKLFVVILGLFLSISSGCCTEQALSASTQLSFTIAPFTNITLDWTVPDDLAELPAIVGGKEMDFKYKDCKKEMDMINKAFIEIMIEGDANGRGFQYPMNMRGLMTPVCA